MYSVFCYNDVFGIGLKVLHLYVFDDTDPDETTYLGVARIPLITLAHDKPIHGTFELIKVFSHIPFHLSLPFTDFSIGSTSFCFCDYKFH